MIRVVVEPVMLLPHKWWRARTEPVDALGRGRAARVWCDDHGYIGDAYVYGRTGDPVNSAEDVAEHHASTVSHNYSTD